MVEAVGVKAGVSRQVIWKKANELALLHGFEGFQANSGWFQRFRRRFDLQRLHLHGEGGEVDLSACEADIAKVTSKISEFHPDNVYNMDETGLFFR